MRSVRTLDASHSTRALKVTGSGYVLAPVVGVHMLPLALPLPPPTATVPCHACNLSASVHSSTRRPNRRQESFTHLSAHTNHNQTPNPTTSTQPTTNSRLSSRTRRFPSSAPLLVPASASASVPRLHSHRNSKKVAKAAAYAQTTTARASRGLGRARMCAQTRGLWGGKPPRRGGGG